MRKIMISLCTVATLCLMLAVVVLASCEKAIINDEGATSDANGSSSTSVTGVTVNTDWAGETHLTF